MRWKTIVCELEDVHALLISAMLHAFPKWLTSLDLSHVMDGCECYVCRPQRADKALYGVSRAIRAMRYAEIPIETESRWRAGKREYRLVYA